MCVCFLPFCKGKSKSLPKTGGSGAKCWLLKAHSEVQVEFKTEINVLTQGEQGFSHHAMLRVLI